MMLTKFLKCLAGAAISTSIAIGFAFPALADTFPAKPVRLISGFAAGGGNDMMARLLAQHLTELWGQQVIVENHPGANTIIAMRLLARSEPDGYTLFLASTAMPINATLYTPAVRIVGTSTGVRV